MVFYRGNGRKVKKTGLEREEEERRGERERENEVKINIVFSKVGIQYSIIFSFSCQRVLFILAQVEVVMIGITNHKISKTSV